MMMALQRKFRVCYGLMPPPKNLPEHGPLWQQQCLADRQAGSSHPKISYGRSSIQIFRTQRLTNSPITKKMETASSTASEAAAAAGLVINALFELSHFTTRANKLLWTQGIARDPISRLSKMEQDRNPSSSCLEASVSLCYYHDLKNCCTYAP